MRIRFLGQSIPLSIAVLAAFEGVLLFLVFLGAGWLRFLELPAQYQLDYGPLWQRGVVFSAVSLGCLLAFGLYSTRQRARSAGIFVRLFAALSAAFLATASIFYVIPDLYIGRGVLIISATGAVVILAALRPIFSHLFVETAFRRRVLVYGAGTNALPIARLRRRSDQRGFVLVGFIRPPGEELAVPTQRLVSLDAELPVICERYAVDELVIAVDDRRSAFPIRELLDCRLAGLDVTELLTFLERETGRVRIDVLNPSWLIFGEGFKRGSTRLLVSRLLDLIGGFSVFVLASPAMLATLVAIKLEEGWRAPIIYRQQRVGLGGKSFQLLKFRSMRVDAEAAGKAVWAQENDPRVTKVGAVIRKLRVDELPQILNVLRGDMSLVGPRPERPQFVADLAEKIPYYVERHTVKPGITGWAQLCYRYGSSEQDALEKLQYDLYYIKNNSFLFDLVILVQTAEVVLMGTGAR
jgi:sugar transferase (PEP-CTERM system associated)